MIEIYKTLNCNNSSFMQECFVRKDTKHDLKTKDLLQIPAAKSIFVVNLFQFDIYIYNSQQFDIYIYNSQQYIHSKIYTSQLIRIEYAK